MRVLVTGASGFVGREIVRQLLNEGHHVRALSRHPLRTEDLQPGLIESVAADLLDPTTLDPCLKDCEAIIHLVGIIQERGRQTFEQVHVEGTRHLLDAARRLSIRRWIQMSALGTRSHALSRYHQSKWLAEEAVRNSGLDWTIFRPSVIYGRGNGFISTFANMMKPPTSWFQLCCIPLFGGGRSRLQPIPVKDVAQCFVKSLSNRESINRCYDLCGPSPETLAQILHSLARHLELQPRELSIPFNPYLGTWGTLLLPIPILLGLFRNRPVQLIHLPYSFGRMLATVMETFLPTPPLTRDQLIMIEEDNVGDPAPAMREFGISPPSFEAGLQSELT